MNAQKLIFVSTTALFNNAVVDLDFCTETDQCERLTDIYKYGQVRKRSSVNLALVNSSY